jgi:hypothetical protein
MGLTFVFFVYVEIETFATTWGMLGNASAAFRDGVWKER